MKRVVPRTVPPRAPCKGDHLVNRFPLGRLSALRDDKLCCVICNSFRSHGSELRHGFRDTQEHVDGKHERKFCGVDSARRVEPSFTRRPVRMSAGRVMKSSMPHLLGEQGVSMKQRRNF